MGFNKRYLPQVSVLERRLEELGRDEFLKIYYFNPDALLGSTESFDFIKAVLDEKQNLVSKK
jgi:hypothetical protein